MKIAPEFPKKENFPPSPLKPFFKNNLELSGGSNEGVNQGFYFLCLEYQSKVFNYLQFIGGNNSLGKPEPGGFAWIEMKTNLQKFKDLDFSSLGIIEKR